MTEATDDGPIEELARLRPGGEPGYLAPGQDPNADALLARIMTTPVRGRRRRRIVIGTFIAATLIGAGTAAAFILTRQPDDPEQISCYSDADIDTADVVSLVADPTRTPASQCEPLWSNGPLGTDGPPRLAECISDTGITAVVPGAETVCDKLGWDHVTPRESNAPPAPGVGLSEALFERFVDHCHDERAATAAVRDALEEAGLTDWTITPLPSPTNDCVTPSPDAPNKTVVLVPLPPQP